MDLMRRFSGEAPEEISSQFCIAKCNAVSRANVKMKKEVFRVRNLRKRAEKIEGIIANSQQQT